MSYEGYRQVLCENGHLSVCEDAPYYDDDPFVCECGAKVAWENSVDDTNCDSYGIIPDLKPFLLTQEVRETCNLGCVHVTKPATYRIPTEEETEKSRCYRDYNGPKDKFVPLHTLRQNTA